MLTTPVAISGRSYILKLDPATNPHLVVNEAAHLVCARDLRIPVAQAQVVADRMGRNGLLVTRFDRVTNTGIYVIQRRTMRLSGPRRSGQPHCYTGPSWRQT